MPKSKENHFDVIIVGAGSAGCALAYRVAANSDLSVLLVEAGSPARNPMLHIPLGFAFLLKDHPNNWCYRTQPERHLAQREVELPRGKVLGGCSAINGMVYVRGQAADYDRWAELGNDGWSYQEVLPYFRRSEHHHDGANSYHGQDGPLWVGAVDNEFPICDAFIEAAQQAGHAANSDINGTTQEGVGFFPTNIKKGRRHSSASAFLSAGKRLPNLCVLTHTMTQRVLFDGLRATGIECISNGQRTVFHAKHEVILSAGAINSPKILELSGVGQASLLQQHDIPLVQHLPGVGENLHDHWNSYIKRSVTSGATYYSESKPAAIMRNLLRYLVTRRGFISNPAALVAVFYKALDEAERADALIHFAPAASNVDAKGNLVPIDGITVASCGVRPTSRGSTHIHSADAEQPPAITVNFLQTEHDQQVAIAAFKKAREICEGDALTPFGGAELEPGIAIGSDADILDYIRTTGEPVHHLAGSCRMGNDELAVVDSALRVRGVDNLRVADASIMPELVSGNTHAACVMIAEKAADLVLAKAG